MKRTELELKVKAAEEVREYQLGILKQALGDIYAGLHRQTLRVEEALKKINQNPEKAVEITEQIVNDIMWTIPNLGMQNLISKVAQVERAQKEIEKLTVKNESQDNER